MASFLQNAADEGVSEAQEGMRLLVSLPNYTLKRSILDLAEAPHESLVASSVCDQRKGKRPRKDILNAFQAISLKNEDEVGMEEEQNFLPDRNGCDLSTQFSDEEGADQEEEECFLSDRDEAEKRVVLSLVYGDVVSNIRRHPVDVAVEKLIQRDIATIAKQRQSPQAKGDSAATTQDDMELDHLSVYDGKAREINIPHENDVPSSDTIQRCFSLPHMDIDSEADMNCS